MTPLRVLVVGAGFGGLSAVRALRAAPVEVILVDEHNYHLFQPLLYQVATALLDPSEIAHPVRALLRRQANCQVRLGRVDDIDLDVRRVRTDQGDIAYDRLIVAAGSVNESLGKPGVERHAFMLKSLGDALTLRNHLLATVERATWATDAAERRRLLTIAVVGAGPTGVETAGAISELVRLVLRRDFTRLDLDELRIVLLEAAQSVLLSFDAPLQRAAIDTLRRKRVELRFGAAVDDVLADGLRLHGGELLEAATVIWTVGVRGAPAGGLLADRRVRHGRIPVTAEMRLADHPEVFVIGDLAECIEDGAPLPMLAPVAIQQGRWVARRIAAELSGDAPAPFRYHDKGTMATIGRNAAVAQIWGLRLSGFPGWALWLGVHIAQIVSFRSRAVTLLNWGRDYFFYDRPVRLIAAPSTTPPRPDGEAGADSADAVAEPQGP
ncbi:MAG TPA: NAD(P)/FAD-dependent oxidoreductase [Candidatus Dormibacteraeota bacterium]